MLWKLWKGVSYVDFKRYIEYITIKILNSLTLRSDEYVTSPNNMHTFSSKQVMRVLKFIW